MVVATRPLIAKRDVRCKTICVAQQTGTGGIAGGSEIGGKRAGLNSG